MDTANSTFSLLIPSFSNRDDFFENLISQEKPAANLIRLFLFLFLFTFFYGAAMGSYHSVLQALSAGIKLPVLFLLVLLICFPAFYIIQYILGSKLSIVQMLSVILSGFVMTATIMVSFIPVIVFFLLTGGNYYFLQLLHIAVIALSGLFGMKNVVDALQYVCDKKEIYPKTGVNVFKFWLVILLFVGIQLAWNLRPFLGDRGEPVQIFRKYEGNFYAALIYSVNQLVKGEKAPVKREEIRVPFLEGEN